MHLIKMQIATSMYTSLLQFLMQYTSHTPSGQDLFGSHRMRQMFVRTHHTEYKWLRVCAQSISLSHSFNITTLYFHVCQLYVL